MIKNIKNKIRILAIIFWLPAMLFVLSVIYSHSNSDIGYAPQQPVKFSHKVHSGDYKIKCLFCHNQAENNSFSALPSTMSCLVCHVALKNESSFVRPLNESYDNQKPLQWTQIHKLPEYVKFNHNIHVLSNIDCATCHGKVETMEITRREKDFTMSWCIDCHRKPAEFIIPGRKITGIFTYPAYKKNKVILAKYKPKTKPAYGGYINQNIFEQYGIKAAKQPGRGPENCSACHY